MELPEKGRYFCTAPRSRDVRETGLCGKPIPVDRAFRALQRGKAPTNCSDQCASVRYDVNRFLKAIKDASNGK